MAECCTLAADLEQQSDTAEPPSKYDHMKLLVELSRDWQRFSRNRDPWRTFHTDVEMLITRPMGCDARGLKKVSFPLFKHSRDEPWLYLTASAGLLISESRVLLASSSAVARRSALSQNTGRICAVGTGMLMRVACDPRRARNIGCPESRRLGEG